MTSLNVVHTLPTQPRSAIRLLLVDDEPAVLRSLQRLFRSKAYQVVTATDGQQALHILENQTFDIIISDMRMPNVNGAQFLQQAAQRWPDTIRMVLTGYADLADAITAINKGQIYRYFSKPWDDQDMRETIDRAAEQLKLKRENTRLQKLIIKQNIELKKLNTTLEQRVEERTKQLKFAADQLDTAYQELKSNYDHTVELLTRFTDMRDAATAGHGRRVAELAQAIAQQMGLNKPQVQNIRSAGLLHDIGKMALPDGILNTPWELLSVEAKQTLSKHAMLGEAALMGLSPLKVSASLIRHHHEHYDGSGYPDALEGEEIPLGSRILSVAEAIDEYCIGIRTGRPLTLKSALEQIKNDAGILYDPSVVKACLAMQDTLASLQKENTPNMLRISSGDAKPGMKLVRDLVSSDGMLLLTAGHELNESIINKIRLMERDDKASYILYIHTTKTANG